ncbi:MAG TPA: energy transducer TonB [Candidatus Acidoferrales bacterium]|jgi:protein TonB|nr:energy transducer TonB [Candidatus Acidoferrales bacterium]
MLSQQNLLLEEVYPGGRPRSSVILPPPQIAPPNRVFAEALLEHSATRQRRSPMDWAVSFFLHLAILAVLLFFPLYFSQGIDMKRLETTLLVAPMPPMAPAPPPPASAARVVHVAPKVFTPGKLTAPTFVPKAIPTASSDAAPPQEAFAGAMGGVPGGIPGGMIGGITGGMPNVAAPVVAAPAAERPKGPVRIGGDVKPPRLIYGPAAVYPILASQSHVHGTVVIDAIIDEHGSVIQEKVVSGHPLLIQAALKAVSERKYEPTILDGEPTPVDLRVEVNFQM